MHHDDPSVKRRRRLDSHENVDRGWDRVTVPQEAAQTHAARLCARWFFGVTHLTVGSCRQRLHPSSARFQNNHKNNHHHNHPNNHKWTDCWWKCGDEGWTPLEGQLRRRTNCGGGVGQFCLGGGGGRFAGRS